MAATTTTKPSQEFNYIQYLYDSSYEAAKDIEQHKAPSTFATDNSTRSHICEMASLAFIVIICGIIAGNVAANRAQKAASMATPAGQIASVNYQK